MTRVAIVDEQDNVLRYTTREALQPTDRHRIACAWIRSTSGKVLLAQRSVTKKFNPNKWALAVAGTLEDDETYESNIRKEIAEELGITNLDLQRGPLFIYQGDLPRNSQVFIGTIPEDTKIVTAPAEVAQVRWFSPHEARAFFETSPEEFTNHAEQWLLPLLDLEAKK